MVIQTFIRKSDHLTADQVTLDPSMEVGHIGDYYHCSSFA